MLAVLQWIGRLYVLTDLRILRLSGTFNIEIFDCPLRKVARCELAGSLKEHVLRLGSVEIAPMIRSAPGDVANHRPSAEVHARIVAAIHRARQGSCG